MRKQIKTSLIIAGSLLGLLVLSIFLHNYLSGLLEREEVFFFGLVMVLICLLPIALFYTIVLIVANLLRHLKGRKKRG